MIWQRGRECPGVLVELSERGCRIETEPVVPGSTIDVAVEAGGMSVSFTGTAVNQSKGSVGTAILAASWRAQQTIKALVHGNVPAAIPAACPSPRRILALGAGGGKILAQLKMIELLEQTLGKSCVNHFDMFAGSSSGALVLGLLAAGKSTSMAREMILSGSTTLGFANPLFSGNLLDKNALHRAVDHTFGELKLGDLQVPFFTVSRNFSSAGHTCYASWTEPEWKFTGVLKRATAIPVLLGSHDNEMDGGAGLFVNPLELLLRQLRSQRSLTDGCEVLYLDAGLDPSGEGEGSGLFKGNVLSQLLWLIGTMLRDLNLAATDRITSEFPRVIYRPYFFTFSKAYDISRKSDLMDAEKEVALRAGDFAAWVRDRAPDQESSIESHGLQG